jgi:glutamate racemase
MPSSSATRPVGVFDSGVGGLSVLQALRHELPHEHFVYLADSGNAPYGERGDAFVQRRTLAIADFLHRQHGIKALVVPCRSCPPSAWNLPSSPPRAAARRTTWACWARAAP